MESISKEQAAEGACVGNPEWLEYGDEIRTLRSRAPHLNTATD